MENTTHESAFLNGELVYCRTPNVDTDIINGKWHSWFNDKITTKYLGQGVYPNTIEKQIQFVDSVKNDKSKVVLSIIEKSSEKHIGVVSFSEIDLINRKAAIAIVIGEKKYSVGAPLEAMALMIEYGFDRLNLNKIWAGQVINLYKWVNLLELIGFRIEGYNEATYIRDGKIQDGIWTGVTAERFYQLRAERAGKICTNNLGELIKKRRKEDLSIPIKTFVENLYK